MGSWIRRGVLHTPKNKFVANDVGAGPVSAQNLQLFFMIFERVRSPAPTIYFETFPLTNYQIKIYLKDYI